MDEEPNTATVGHGSRYLRHQLVMAELRKMQQQTPGWCVVPRLDVDDQVEAAHLAELVQVQEDGQPQVAQHLYYTTALFLFPHRQPGTLYLNIFAL